jgi:hypothetical protein
VTLRDEWSEWWLPGAEDNRATGELEFDAAEGPRLILFGDRLNARLCC